LFEGTDHEIVELSPPDVAERASMWRRALREQDVRASDDDVDAVADLFSLYPSQIQRASTRARPAGHSEDVDLTYMAAAARGQCTRALDELAEHVPLLHTWSDLVLPLPTLRRLREFSSAIRCRDRVFREWSFWRPAGGTASLRALFSGASGTGKTMSAAVVARDLGVDLFRIDLSAVVSKYIGETEKNLERIFTAAEGSNAILLFDEADALFGKRSEVKDAHDRYANIEVAYLLQRMETYDGVMILATNLAKHLDEAFSRRIHFDIEFPLPDQEQRERLWRQLIPAAAPTSDDVDHGFLARQFQLTGGEIRNVAIAAAFLAAHEECEIRMQHLVRAIARQRRKQGKMPTSAEFKHHLAAVHEDGV
jgi:SpoVK/Ycf46/Vps4 family AAA+-type ATPase